TPAAVSPTPRKGGPGTPTRLDSLTGLRWLAALAIFCMHFAYEDTFAGPAKHLALLQKITYGAPSAVSFFFILSGFVLAWSIRPGDSRTGFWWRRFSRIYPAHFVTFLAAVALALWLGSEMRPGIALANLTLTQSWIPNARNYWFGFNSVSWSLSCEFFFYFTFPFLAPALKRLHPRKLWLVLAASAAFVILLPLAAGPVHTLTGWQGDYLAYVLPLTRLPEFLAGIAAAFLVKQGHWRGPGVTLSLALSAVALLWLVRLVPKVAHFSACTIVPYILLIAAAARSDITGAFSLLRKRGLVYLGEVSFCFYLTHELVISASNHVMQGHGKIPLLPNMLAVFSVSLVLAALLHELIEKPGVKLLGRLRTR
ncbi:hypothetical protein ADL22_12805, partial [Streptomyces sp. NRRL F-4489]|uniref:acyltransferase family protein n=1 Tax=Streptomyces sp. NRRL F-4489 TaxID=1609095 RepID=UPI000749C984